MNYIKECYSQLQSINVTLDLIGALWCYDHSHPNWGFLFATGAIFGTISCTFRAIRSKK